MNSVIRRHCQYNIKRCLSKENVNGLLRVNTSLETTIRTRLTRPTEYNFPIPRKHKEYSKDQDTDSAYRLGAYGYFLLGIPITTFLLGTWQVQRRKWKLNLIADLNSRVNQPPIELPETLDELQSLEYYPVKVRGTFLYDKEIYVGPRSLILDGGASNQSTGLLANQDSTGYHVVTPFRLEDRNLTILINRGWIPKKHKKLLKEKDRIENVVDITGIVRLNEKRPPFFPGNIPEKNVWHYRDVYAMADLTNAEPIFLDMTSKIPGAPISGQTKVSLRNEHLTYIITWYSLTVGTGYLWYRIFIQKLPLR